VLADSNGLPPDGLRPHLPAGVYAPLALVPLEQWLLEARTSNPALRGLRFAL